jgi:hypothetical protein
MACAFMRSIRQRDSDEECQSTTFADQRAKSAQCSLRARRITSECGRVGTARLQQQVCRRAQMAHRRFVPRLRSPCFLRSHLPARRTANQTCSPQFVAVDSSAPGWATAACSNPYHSTGHLPYHSSMACVESSAVRACFPRGTLRGYSPQPECRRRPHWYSLQAPRQSMLELDFVVYARCILARPEGFGGFTKAYCSGGLRAITARFQRS